MLASVPSKPTDIVLSDTSVTSDTKIKVTFAEPEPTNNGSPILSYELVMDDGKSGNFVSVQGFTQNNLKTEATITEGVIKGREHRFKYRARNAIGWGEYSDVSAVLAATVPQKALQPTFLSFSADVLTVVVPRS
jgi:hypothetical protein